MLLEISVSVLEKFVILNSPSLKYFTPPLTEKNIEILLHREPHTASRLIYLIHVIYPDIHMSLIHANMIISLTHQIKNSTPRPARQQILPKTHRSARYLITNYLSYLLELHLPCHAVYRYR